MVEQGFYLRKLVPELMEVVQRRYNILLTIGYLEPIGRRMLAEKLNLGERTVRNDVEIFRQQELILADAKGVSLSKLGKKTLGEFSNLIHFFRGLADFEKRLASQLGIKEVVIVPGNIDKEPLAKEELGRVSAYYFNKAIENVETVAVAGGTTLASLAEHIIPQNKAELVLLPARGGLGEQVEIQANTIVAKIAKKLGANYRLLHVPDYMSITSAQQLSHDPFIAPIMEMIRNSDVLVHGIGCALEMAERRGISQEELEELKRNGAQGEVFGYYFDNHGNIVYSTPNIGLKLDDLGKISTVVAIAGGKVKASAIEAVAKASFIDLLITDEGAAMEILKS